MHEKQKTAHSGVTVMCTLGYFQRVYFRQSFSCPLDGCGSRLSSIPLLHSVNVAEGSWEHSTAYAKRGSGMATICPRCKMSLKKHHGGDGEPDLERRVVCRCCGQVFHRACLRSNHGEGGDSRRLEELFPGKFHSVIMNDLRALRHMN